MYKIISDLFNKNSKATTTEIIQALLKKNFEIAVSLIGKNISLNPHDTVYLCTLRSLRNVMMCEELYHKISQLKAGNKGEIIDLLQKDFISYLTGRYKQTLKNSEQNDILVIFFKDFDPKYLNSLRVKDLIENHQFVETVKALNVLYIEIFPIIFNKIINVSDFFIAHYKAHHLSIENDKAGLFVQLHRSVSQIIRFIES